MMNDKPNFNLMALRGATDIDDMEVCETLGIDPKYAYTPELNDVAIQQQIDANILYYQQALGMSEQEARAKAEKAAHPVRQEIQEALMARKSKR